MERRRFIPLTAPHFGQMGSRDEIDEILPTLYHWRYYTHVYHEKLSTLTQIEALLNSRPLCPMTEDAEDYMALTSGPSSSANHLS